MPPFTLSGRWLAAALIFASASNVALVASRVVLTGQLRFLYLPYNLFLAWLPLGFALLAWRCHTEERIRSPKFLTAAFLWLLFLPNAPYLITDLIHLTPRPPVPIWVDMVMIVSFAWTGLMLGFISVYLMHRLVRARFGRVKAWIFVLLTLGLSGAGIYIGRFLRWNSWDIFLNPLEVAWDILMQFRHPLANPAPVIYTILFTQVLLAGYLMVYAMTKLKMEESQRLP